MANLKIQVSMQHLIVATFFAILSALGVAGMFGIRTLQEFKPQACVLTPPFYCTSPQLSTDGTLAVNIGQKSGLTITINKIACVDESLLGSNGLPKDQRYWSNIGPISIAPNSYSKITNMKCFAKDGNPFNGAVGSSFVGRIVVDATTQRGTSIFSSGRISGVAKIQHYPAFGTWLWHTWVIRYNQTKLLNYLKQNGFNEVYLQIDQNINATTYANFISRATNYGIKVYALEGEPEWLYPQSRTGFLNFMTWVKNYNSQVSDDKKFSGIHLDEEPWVLPEWDTNRNYAIQLYQDFVKEALDGSHSIGLPLILDVPFWFPQISFSNSYGSGNLGEWVISNADGTNVLSFRDSSPSITSISQDSVNYAKKYFKPISISVDIQPEPGLGYITFYEEGPSYMYSEIEKVKNYYSQSYSNINFAVHYLEALMARSSFPTYAARFNGIDSYINVPDNSALDLPTTLTISLWLYPNSNFAGYSAEPLSKMGDTTDANFILYYFGTTSGINRRIGFYANRGGTWGLISSYYTLSLNQWYHIVLSYNSSKGGQLYINGAAIDLPVGSGNLAVNGVPLRIGSLFNGSIANVQIYNTSLTPEEIKYLYIEGLGGAPIRFQNLAAWWPLNGDAKDYSNNHIDGTASNVAFAGYALP